MCGLSPPPLCAQEYKCVQVCIGKVRCTSLEAHVHIGGTMDQKNIDALTCILVLKVKVFVQEDGVVPASAIPWGVPGGLLPRAQNS